MRAHGRTIVHGARTFSLSSDTRESLARDASIVQARGFEPLSSTWKADRLAINIRLRVPHICVVMVPRVARGTRAIRPSRGYRGNRGSCECARIARIASNETIKMITFACPPRARTRISRVSRATCTWLGSRSAVAGPQFFRALHFIVSRRGTTL